MGVDNMDRGTRSSYQKFVSDRRNQAERYFQRKCADVHPKYPFCLPSRQFWKENIIDHAVAPFINAEIKRRATRNQGFALHKWVHHGLSSQAFLFNLLGPLVARRDYDTLGWVLESVGLPLRGAIDRAEFEYEDRLTYNETPPRQPTSVDLAVWTNQDDAVFIECKFTEPGFGGCANCRGENPLPDFAANCFLARERRRGYWQVFQAHRLPHTLNRDSDSCPLSSGYQIYRLMGFSLEQGARLMLLYDERNPVFVGPQGVYCGFVNELPKALGDRCHAVSAQAIVRVLRDRGAPAWLEEFEAKYL